MTTLTAAELKVADPERFKKEYHRWTGYGLYDEWWEGDYETFKDRCSRLGIRVDDISFSGFYSPGDGASFRARVCLTMFMEHTKLHLEYPALYIAVKNDGSYMMVEPTRNNYLRGGSYEMWANQTAPEGVFADLDQDTWSELVDEQDSEAGMEDRVIEFCRGLADELHSNLESTYENLTSEDEFIASCEANEITFETEGEAT